MNVLPLNAVVELIGLVEDVKAVVPLCSVVVERPNEPVPLVTDAEIVPVKPVDELVVDVEAVVPTIRNRVSQLISKKEHIKLFIRRREH